MARHEKVCLFCGEGFESERANKKYCSNACRRWMAKALDRARRKTAGEERPGGIKVKVDPKWLRRGDPNAMRNGSCFEAGMVE